MGFLELFLIGVGLSMDAFAVSVCRGLAMPRMDWRQGALAALFFGGFQALMPLAGWGLGRKFEQYMPRRLCAAASRKMRLPGGECPI